MDLRRPLAAGFLLTSLVACADTGTSDGAVRGQWSADFGQSTASPVISFEPGLIDASPRNQGGDAKLLPDGRLAVLTFVGGCPDQPVAVSGSGQDVTVTYRAMPVDEGAVCDDGLAPYTAVLRLPETVDRALPLRVTLLRPEVASYTLNAR